LQNGVQTGAKMLAKKTPAAVDVFPGESLYWERNVWVQGTKHSPTTFLEGRYQSDETMRS